MPSVVPETAILYAPPPSQAGRSRSSGGADADAGPFSMLLDSPGAGAAQNMAPPERADTAERARSQPALRDDKTAAQPDRTEAAVPAPKAKHGKDTKDAKKTDDADVPSAAKNVASDIADTKQAKADATADAGKNGDDPVSGIEPDPPLLAADVLASPTADTSAVAVVTAPVPAPPMPSTPIPSGAGMDEIGKIAAAAVAETGVSPAADAMPSAIVTETVAASAPAATSTAVARTEGPQGAQASDAAPAAAVIAETGAASAPIPVPAAASKTGGSQSAQAPDAAHPAMPVQQAAVEPQDNSTDTPDIAAALSPVSDPATANARGEINSPKVPEAGGKSPEGHARGELADIAASANAHAALRSELQVTASDPNSTLRTGVDPTSNPSLSPATAAMANSAATSASQTASSAAAVPVSGLAVEIAARAQTGKNRFEIRLDPPELGRIDVRLDIDRHGNVTSHLRVDRAETLDLLRRDAPNLERAFQQAGLKTSDNGLQFSLRDQAFSGRDNSGQTAPTMARLIVPDDKLAPIETMQRSYGRLAGLGGGVDIRV